MQARNSPKVVERLLIILLASFAKEACSDERTAKRAEGTDLLRERYSGAVKGTEIGPSCCSA